jgi:hypothetical protein
MLAFRRVGLFGNAALIGGKFHLKLNIDWRPIANKYREGKMKRTLKRELKVLEIVKREAIGSSIPLLDNQLELVDKSGKGKRILMSQCLFYSNPSASMHLFNKGAIVGLSFRKKLLVR